MCAGGGNALPCGSQKSCPSPVCVVHTTLCLWHACVCVYAARWHDLLQTDSGSTFSHEVIEFAKAAADVQTPGFTLCLSLSVALFRSLLLRVPLSSCVPSIVFLSSLALYLAYFHIHTTARIHIPAQPTSTVHCIHIKTRSTTGCWLRMPADKRAPTHCKKDEEVLLWLLCKTYKKNTRTHRAVKWLVTQVEP